MQEPPNNREREGSGGTAGQVNTSGTAVPAATASPPVRQNAAGRLLAVLDAFGPRHRALSLSEISRRAGLSLSTAHRLVSELVNWGALERDANGRYSIGLRLLELAALAPRGLELREAAFPYLDELHQRTRGNVHLGVRDGLEVVYVETMRARPPGRPISSRIGDRWPMHATGTGLVLLALAERDLQERALQGPLEKFTPLTITDPTELRRMLARIRQSGVAVTRGQITLPDMAVAVPVYDPYGGVAAAISVVVEAETARPKVLAAMLNEAAAAISRRLAPRAGRGGVDYANVAAGRTGPLAARVAAVSAPAPRQRARLVLGSGVGAIAPVRQAVPGAASGPAAPAVGASRPTSRAGAGHGTTGATGATSGATPVRSAAAGAGATGGRGHHADLIRAGGYGSG